MKMTSTADNATDASNLPAMTPPLGLVSNFKNPYSRGFIIIFTGSVLISLMMIFFAFRMYAKARIQKRLWWDDLTCGLAGISAIIFYMGCIFWVKSGLGVHKWNIKAESMANNPMILKALIMTMIPPSLGLGFAKVTFFLMYYQLFWPKSSLRYPIYIGGIVTAVFYAAMTISMFVFLSPRSGETLFTHQQNPTYRNVHRFSVPISAANAAIDLYILVLPIAAVIQLQLATKHKIGMVLIFLTGFLAVIASFVSIYYRILFVKSKDITWNASMVLLLNLTELCVGVICSCMPSLSKTLQYHASHFSKLKSLFFSRFKYLSELLSRIVPSTEPKSLNPFNRKTKKEFSELEKGMSACGGIQDGRLEGLPQYRVESLGTNRFRTFVGVEDQIYLKHDVTVSRQ